MSWEDIDHSKQDCGIECPFCRCPILDRPVVNADGVGISAGTSEISIVIDPVHRDGEDDHITMSCTPLTTAQSIIEHLDQMIRRSFQKDSGTLKSFVDIGSNHGIMSFFAFKNGATSVIAVEPNHFLSRLILRGFQRNKMPDAELFNRHSADFHFRPLSQYMQTTPT